MAKGHKLSREKIIFQLSYKPSLSFYDQLFKIASQLPGYPDWETDRLKVVLKDFTNKCSVGICHDSLIYDQDSPNITIENDRVSDLISFSKEKLSIEQYLRIGLRQQFLCPVELTPTDLSKVMHVKFYSNSDELSHIIGRDITDLYFKIDATDGELKYHFFVTPIIKSTIPQHLLFNRQYHLSNEERAINYGKLLSSYPNVAIFIDVDCFTDLTANIENAKEIYTKAKSISKQKVIKLVEYILATKIEE